MRRIGPDFIDYWQGSCGSSPRSRFGIRFRDGRIWVVRKLGDEPANTYGIGYPIPVQIETLPAYVRMVVDNHLLNYPTSDVLDVLAGTKPFLEALQFPSTRAAAHFYDPLLNPAVR